MCPHKVYTIQVAKKSAKYTVQQPAAAGVEDAVADDDDADADDNALQTFSKSQHRQLAMQQLSAIRADADVAAAKSVSQKLAQPATAQSLEQPADAYTVDGDLQPVIQAHLTLAISFLDKVFESRRLAATKLLMFKLQLLDHSSAITVSRFWVAHEDEEMIRRTVDHHLRSISEASQGQLTAIFTGYDGAHHRQRDGEADYTNLNQIKAGQRDSFQKLKTALNAQAAAAAPTGTMSQRKKVALYAQYKAAAVPFPPLKRHQLAGAAIAQESLSADATSQSLELMQCLIGSELQPSPELFTVLEGVQKKQKQRKQFPPIKCNTADAAATGDVQAQATQGPTPPSTSNNSVPAVPQQPAAQLPPPCTSSTSVPTVPQQPTAQLPNEQPQQQGTHQLLCEEEYRLVGTAKKGHRLSKCGTCHHCEHKHLKKPCLYFKAIAAIGTSTQEESSKQAMSKTGALTEAQTEKIHALVRWHNNCGNAGTAVPSHGDGAAQVGAGAPASSSLEAAPAAHAGQLVLESDGNDVEVWQPAPVQQPMRRHAISSECPPAMSNDIWWCPNYTNSFRDSSG